MSSSKAAVCISFDAGVTASYFVAKSIFHMDAGDMCVVSKSKAAMCILFDADVTASYYVEVDLGHGRGGGVRRVELEVAGLALAVSLLLNILSLQMFCFLPQPEHLRSWTLGQVIRRTESKIVPQFK